MYAGALQLFVGKGPKIYFGNLQSLKGPPTKILPFMGGFLLCAVPDEAERPKGVRQAKSRRMCTPIHLNTLYQI